MAVFRPDRMSSGLVKLNGIKISFFFLAIKTPYKLTGYEKGELVTQYECFPYSLMVTIIYKVTSF